MGALLNYQLLLKPCDDESQSENVKESESRW